MVSKDVAQKKHAEYQKANESAKAKQDAIIAGSKQSRSDNRGYNYSSKDAKGNVVGAVKGVPYTFNAETGESTGTLPQNLKDQQTKILQTRQMRESKLQEDIQKKNDAKLISNNQIEDSKQTRYDNRGYDYEDTTGEIYHGNNPSSGQWYYNPKTQESYGNVPETVKKNEPSESTFAKVEDSPLNEVSNNNQVIVQSEKVRVDEDYSKQLEKEAMIIKSKEELEKRNNEASTKFWLEEGKKAGFKEVKITSDGKTEIVSIDSDKFFNISSDAEFSFVPTEEMKQERKDVLKSQKEFLLYGKKEGYKEIKIKSKDKTEIVSLDNLNIALKKIYHSSPDSEITFVNTPEHKQKVKDIRAQQKDYVKYLKEQNYKEFYIKSKENGIEVFPVEQGYKALVKAKPDSEVGPIDYPTREEKNIPEDPYSKTLYNFEKHVEKSKNPVIQFFGSALVEVGSGIASIANLIGPRSSYVKNKDGSVSFKEHEPYQYYTGKPSVPQGIVGSPFKVGAELVLDNSTERQNKTPEQNIEDFRTKTKQEWYRTYQLASEQPIPKTAGQTFGFIFSVVPNRLKELSPLKITRTPFYTSEGVKNFVTTLRIGYGDKTKLIAGRYSQTGKFFTSQKPEVSGIEKISGPSGNSSFETYEFADYSKRQIQDIKPSIEYAEKTGVIAKGDFESVIAKSDVEKKIASKKNLFEYEKKISPSNVEKQFEGVKGKESLETISKQQKNNLDLKKGSDIVNALFGSIKTKVHDLDFTAKTDKKSVIASKALYDVGAKEGFVLRQKGTNISVGKIDTNKPFWNLVPYIDESKGLVIRGDAQKFAVKFARNSDPTFLPRKELFTSNNEVIAKRFARRNAKTEGSKEAYLQSEIDLDKILFYGKLSKTKRAELASEDWYTFQENMKNEAIKQGKLGYTKPYFSTDPNALRYEYVIFDKGAIKGTELIKPTSYGILKGTERDFVNIVTSQDERISSLGIKTEKFFGDKIKTGKISQVIEGTNRKIKSQDFAQQMIDWGRSTSGVISKKTLKGYRGDTSEFENLFRIDNKDVDVRIGFPLVHRLKKDLGREYFFGLRESARFAWQKGDKQLAKDIGLIMNTQYHRYKDIFNWKNLISELKAEGVVSIEPSSKTDLIKSYGLSFAKQSGPSVKTASVYSNNKINDEEIYSTKSVSSKNSFSNKLSSIFRIRSNKSLDINSVKSSKSVSPIESSKSYFIKPKSTTSLNLNSIKSIFKIYSVKSPNNFSVKSSPVSSSRSTKSYSSKSLTSPSAKSVNSFSPKSASVKVRTVKFVPLINIKFVRQPKIIIPLLDFARGPKKYNDISKHSITFRWATKNPVFKKFSIREGNRKRRLEW